MSAFVSLLAASAVVRAASLNLCSDEYLLLLARAGEVASLSRLAHDPHDSALWRRAQGVPTNHGRVEELIGTGASLLVTVGGGAKSSASIARHLKLATLDLPYPATIADVEANMVRTARALGDERRADRWRAELARLRARPPEPRDAIFLSSGGFSVSPGSLSDQWMRLAGFAQRALPGGRATLEMLITAPPARILRSDYRGDQASLGQRWLDQPAVMRLARRAVATDGRPWTCAGPLMIGEIARLRQVR